MRRFSEGTGAVLLLAALLAPLGGCNRNEPLPPITITTPQPERVLYAQTAFSGFLDGLWISIPVEISTRGKLDITVDWTYEDTWMYVFFGDTKCEFPQLSTGTCPFLIESATKDPKPRVLFTDFVDPRTYYVVLYNVPRDPRLGIGSDNNEAVAVQIGLTVGFTSSQEGETPVRLGRPVVASPPRL